MPNPTFPAGLRGGVNTEKVDPSPERRRRPVDWKRKREIMEGAGGWKLGDGDMGKELSIRIGNKIAKIVSKMTTIFQLLDIADLKCPLFFK